MYAQPEGNKIIANIIRQACDDLIQADDDIDYNLGHVARAILKRLHPIHVAGRGNWRRLDLETQEWRDLSRHMRLEDMWQPFYNYVHERYFKDRPSPAAARQVANLDALFSLTVTRRGKRRLSHRINRAGGHSPFREHRVPANYDGQDGVTIETATFIDRYMLDRFPSGLEFHIDPCWDGGRKRLERIIDARVAYAHLRMCVSSVFDSINEEGTAWHEHRMDSKWNATGAGQLIDPLFELLLDNAGATSSGGLPATRRMCERVCTAMWPCGSAFIRIAKNHATPRRLGITDGVHNWPTDYAEWNDHFDVTEPRNLIRIESPASPTVRDLVKMRVIRRLFRRLLTACEALLPLDRADRVVLGIRQLPLEVREELRDEHITYARNLLKLDGVICDIARERLAEILFVATQRWRHEMVCRDGKPGILYKLAKRSWETNVAEVSD